MSVDAGTLEENIEVTIRCALQSNPDETMTVPLLWSVKELKDHIQSVYPSHPKASSQKLIFCGRCLNDEYTLRLIFNETRRVIGAPQVLHLVSPMAIPNPEIRQRRPNPTESAPTTPAPSYDAVANGWSDYYSRVMNDPNAMNAYREYYNNYMNYLQHYSNAMMNMNALPHPVFVNNGPGIPMTPYYHNTPNVNAQNPVNPNPQINANGNVQQPQYVPPGRRFENGLDMFYNFFRALLLLSAVLLYSSLERFLLVTAIIAIMVFTQHRRAQNRQAALAAAQHVNNNNAGEERIQEEPPTPEQNNSANTNSEGTENVSGIDEQEEVRVPEPAPPSASLIPENNVPIEVN